MFFPRFSPDDLPITKEDTSIIGRMANKDRWDFRVGDSGSGKIDFYVDHSSFVPAIVCVVPSSSGGVMIVMTEDPIL